MVSRQRRYQLRHSEKGLCILCSRPRSFINKKYCDLHLQHVKESRIDNEGLTPKSLRNKGKKP